MPDRAKLTNGLSDNPFTTKFGKVPTYFAGREMIIDDVTHSLDNGSDEICGMFVGARGTGKTALLTYFSSIAEELGWVSINVSSISGMLDDVLQQLMMRAGHLLEPAPRKKLKGVKIPGVASIEWDNLDKTDFNWRTQVSKAIDAAFCRFRVLDV